MKKIIFLVFLVLLIGGKVSAQVKVLGNLTTNGPATYPTHIDSLGYSGYRVVKDLTERDAIATQRRKYGMLVYVQSNDNLYVLKDVNLGNSNWQNLSALISPTSLGQLNSLSVSGTIEGGIFSGTLSSSAQNSITSLGNVQSLTVSNNFNAPNISVSGSVVAGTLSGTLNAGTLNTITSLANLSALTVLGNITSNTLSTVSGVIGDLRVPGTITGGNFSGTFTGILASSAQSKITTVGQLSNLSVSGTVEAGTISGTNLRGTLLTVAQPNISSVGLLNNLSVSGTIEGGSFSGTLSSTAQRSITSLANVQALTVSGSISAASIAVSGTVSGATISGTSVQASRFLANLNNVVAATNLTIDLSQGNVISLPLTTNTTISFSNAPTNPASYVLKVSYTTATAFTITWPASVKWSGNTAPTLTCAIGKIDIVSLIWDGTSYYSTYALNF